MHVVYNVDATVCEHQRPILARCHVSYLGKNRFTVGFIRESVVDKYKLSLNVLDFYKLY